MVTAGPSTVQDVELGRGDRRAGDEDLGDPVAADPRQAKAAVRAGGGGDRESRRDRQRGEALPGPRRRRGPAAWASQSESVPSVAYQRRSTLTRAPATGRPSRSTIRPSIGGPSSTSRIVSSRLRLACGSRRSSSRARTRAPTRPSRGACRRGLRSGVEERRLAPAHGEPTIRPAVASGTGLMRSD